MSRDTGERSQRFGLDKHAYVKNFHLQTALNRHRSLTEVV